MGFGDSAANFAPFCDYSGTVVRPTREFVALKKEHFVNRSCWNLSINSINFLWDIFASHSMWYKEGQVTRYDMELLGTMVTIGNRFHQESWHKLNEEIATKTSLGMVCTCGERLLERPH